nr:hypothetical protein GCM10020092_037540 [Actinoplanes digitatis]
MPRRWLSTFQNLSGGRLLLNVVTGGESHEQRMYGDHLDKDARYERCGEFLDIVRALWSGKPVEVEGKYYHLSDAVLSQRPDPLPGVYFGGSSPAALDVAARHADVYLTWGEPPAAVGEKVRRVRELAERQGRDPAFGLRVHTIARDTAEEAWAEASRLLAEHLRRADPRGAGRAAPQRVRGPAADARPQRRLPGLAGDPSEPVGRRRAGARRRRHRAGRQPPADRGPRRAVRRGGRHGVRAIRVPAPRGGVPLRRGRAARAVPPRALAASGARPAGGRRRAVRRRPDRGGAGAA